MGVEQAAGHVVERDDQVLQRHRGVQVFVAIEQRHGLGGGDVLHDDL